MSSIGRDGGLRTQSFLQRFLGSAYLPPENGVI